MSKDIILPLIELRESQLENLERSGFFTDKEINQKAELLRLDVKALKAQFNHYGMTYDQYVDAVQLHDYYFSQIPTPAVLNTWNILGMNQISRG
jgi:hypothetical protein